MIVNKRKLSFKPTPQSMKGEQNILWKNSKK